MANVWFEGYTPIEGTVAIIDRLREAHYELFFLSDNVAERVYYLERKYSFLSKFTAGIFSHIEKAIKPDIRLYQTVLAKAKSPASECVYVDDKPKCIEPARTLGMHVIAFENPLQLEIKLKELGLQF